MRLNVTRQLTSKRTVLSLMLLLLAAVLLSFLIPQRFNTSAADFARWQQAHQAWLPVTEALGLHRVFTAPWFAVLLFCFLVSLAIAIWQQFDIARRRTFGSAARPPLAACENNQGARSLRLLLPEAELTQVLRQEGYLRMAAGEGVRRYVRHPWGYWGGFFLHLGIFIAIAASLLVAVTEKRGGLRLAEGEVHPPGASWALEEHGILAGPLRLPAAVRLDRVSPEFWPRGGLKSLASEIRFIAPDGRAEQRRVDIAAILNYRGLRIYQVARFGNSFHLLFTDRAGSRGEVVLDIPSPLEPDQASYGNFDFVEIPYHLKAKYYADAGRRTLVSDNPLLVLRLVADNQVIGELPLRQGEAGQLGPYGVELVRVARWTDLTFLDTTGMWGVFLGCFIFTLGSFLNYFTIPREIYGHKRDGCFLLTRKGARFPQQDRGEFEAIRERLQKMEKP